MLVYSFLIYELGRYEDLERAVPETLTRIVTGGDTIMPWVYDVLRKRLPHVNLTQSYGLTEGGALAVVLDMDDAAGHENSVGRPQPMTEVKVVDLEGDEVQIGEVGEVCVRSPGGSIGFWERPEENAETFRDGWCRTGDLGKVGADGILTLAGRSKDMIRSGGENIYAAEVEKVITAHPDVRDVALVAVPDPVYHEVGCAVLVPEKADLDIDTLREHLRGQLAKYKVPKYFVVVDDLPRNANGKVLKYQLRDDYRSISGAAN